MARKEHCRDTMQTSLLYFTPKKDKPQFQWNKYEDWQQQYYTQKLTQKQREQLFLSLYKNKKQEQETKNLA